MATTENSSDRLADVARRGQEAFERYVRLKLRPEDDGKYVAVEIGTGDYEVDADDYTAVTRLRSRRPDGEIWLERAGRPTAYQLRSGR
jgi:hypothetical protein